MQQSHYQQISLDPLGAEEVQQLVADLLGKDAPLADLGDHIYARTGGNPFFVEEIVQSLVESGQLEGQRGTYRMTSRAADLTIPPTVHEVRALLTPASRERALEEARRQRAEMGFAPEERLGETPTG